MRLKSAICVMICASGLSAYADTIALTLGGGEDAGATFGAGITLGWEFTVSGPLTVTQLGIYDSVFSGLAQAHDVGIWNDSGSLLVSGTVPSDNAAADLGSFRFVAVPETPLPIGTYYIGAEYVANSSDDALLYEPSADITTASQITFVDNFYTYSGSLAFPLNSGNPALEFYFGPNFQFVSEPSAFVLTNLGLVLLAVGRYLRRSRSQRRRNPSSFAQ